MTATEARATEGAEGAEMREPQKAQMAQAEIHDGLDCAIDRIAARLTRVDDDPQMAARIVAALPERETWFGWLAYAWAPRLAAVAAIVAAGVLWSARQGMVDPSPAPAIAGVKPFGTNPDVWLAAGIEPIGTQPLEPFGTQPLERLERLEPLEPVDFDRSLPPVEAVAALGMDSLMPASLPEDAPLTVEPLAVTALPLSAEFIPPR